MTELNSIKAGDKVLVKIGRNLIECEALAVSPVGVTVRSLSTGREFTTARIEEVAGRAEPNPPATEASEPLKTSLTEMPVEEPADEKNTDEEDAAEGAAAADESKPRKKLSLLNAAIEVLKAEGRPLNTRELVKLAKDRGLWTPTGCRTPEQSLYGAFFLEIKNAEKPRIRKSAERGKFELA